MPPSLHPAPAILHALPRMPLAPQISVVVILVAVVFVNRWLRKQWMQRRQAARERNARNWPTLTATIEVISVAGGILSEKGLFAATLTYFYRNPELQMGEYQRAFTTKASAKAWVTQFKNRTVLVHVNPADPSNSVLFSSEIAGADVPEPRRHEPARAITESNAESFVAGDSIHALTPGMRLLCGLAELAGLAGFATSAVLLLSSLLSKGPISPRIYFWVGGALLCLALGCTVVLYLELLHSDSGRQLLRTYRRWCPAWMRWTLPSTGAFFTIFWPILDLTRSLWSPFMHPLAKRLAPHLPYLLGCWVFLVLAAFLAAILGSQEDPRSAIETVRA
jgi:hypothetical protein